MIAIDRADDQFVEIYNMKRITCQYFARIRAHPSRRIHRVRIVRR
ncbi:MAG TPA: hypothetical protein VJ144_05550 [Candidatus Polarisedimenticolia bacterium]|nr:hypothetical protein [Candidatus Polarisedimenticolia bacterium]